MMRVFFFFVSAVSVLILTLFPPSDTVFSSAFSSAVFAQAGWTQKGFADADGRISADILKAMLAAKTPEEKNYCEYVVSQRNAGRLPSGIFYGVYKKTMSKDRSRRFYYFKYALESVCKQERIPLYAPAK